jgi:glyoxylase I family protein
LAEQGIKYVHTNLVARDWRKLADFYIQVFGCQPVPPQRDLQGNWLERLTGVAGASLQGIHLRLPGYDSSGPTLEIFQYEQKMEAVLPAINRQGLTHIAFSVPDVAAARERVLAAGGSDLGEVVTQRITGAGQVTVAYLRDPEGNLIEVQCWE